MGSEGVLRVGAHGLDLVREHMGLKHRLARNTRGHAAREARAEAREAGAGAGAGAGIRQVDIVANAMREGAKRLAARHAVLPTLLRWLAHLVRLVGLVGWAPLWIGWTGMGNTGA